MRKFFIVTVSSFFVVLSAIFLNSCVKDNCKRTYTYSFYVPVYKTTMEIKAGIKNGAAREVINPGKFVLLGNYIFINEIDKGIHVIDNLNPASPQNIAFINIPGNMDLALKGNTLYADLYTDLATIDISNPLGVTVKRYNEGVFPYRAYGSGFYDDTTRIIASWIKRDTTITENCATEKWVTFDSQVYYNYSSTASSSGNKSSMSPICIGGLMAKFAIVNNRMYTVSNSNLNVFNITITDDPVYKNKVVLSNWNIETIFPFKNKLFIGSQNGMFVYNINKPDKPALTGQFADVQSCDPVIADDDAYVTLRTGSACFGNTNQLEILRLNSFTNPMLVKSYPFPNPHGLSKDGNLLFNCDGSDRLKIYNSKEVANLQLIKQFSSIEIYDVIAFGRIALVVAKDGLYQYDYSDVNNIHLVSKIGITRR